MKFHNYSASTYQVIHRVMDPKWIYQYCGWYCSLLHWPIQTHLYVEELIFIPAGLYELTNFMECIFNKIMVPKYPSVTMVFKI